MNGITSIGSRVCSMG